MGRRTLPLMSRPRTHLFKSSFSAHPSHLPYLSPYWKNPQTIFFRPPNRRSYHGSRYLYMGSYQHSLYNSRTLRLLFIFILGRLRSNSTRYPRSRHSRFQRWREPHVGTDDGWRIECHRREWKWTTWAWRGGEREMRGVEVG